MNEYDVLIRGEHQTMEVYLIYFLGLLLLSRAKMCRNMETAFMRLSMWAKFKCSKGGSGSDMMRSGLII